MQLRDTTNVSTGESILKAAFPLCLHLEHNPIERQQILTCNITIISSTAVNNSYNTKDTMPIKDAIAGQ